MINKTDLLEGDERGKALKFISDRLRTGRKMSLSELPLSVASGHGPKILC